ncbi:hypothetical protein [Synechococcus sp. C9]|uniref:hypothetical protein n=1 Tax=Synechococcus sp. C9 TaxID=102119 RepID=UPI001FF2E5BB|nr:hypothetical protein [Synechococcus sp. C9]
MVALRSRNKCDSIAYLLEINATLASVSADNTEVLALGVSFISAKSHLFPQMTMEVKPWKHNFLYPLICEQAVCYNDINRTSKYLDFLRNQNNSGYSWMKHRHLELNEKNRWCLAAIDDVISRGSLSDWIELLRALQSQAMVRNKLKQVIRNYPSESEQSYRFFERVLEGEPRGKPPELEWNWLATILHLTMTDFTWEDLLSVASRLQGVLPDAVLVGGTASALYAQHRISFDTDHILPNLQSIFDEVLSDLESVSGWQTARCRRPVLILGSLDGIETGIRQLIRSRPLETQVMDTPGGMVRVPTLPEMLRIKSFLVIRRNATRDYLDTVALANLLGTHQSYLALQQLDEYYPQPNHQSVLQQLLRQLAQPLPFDLDSTDLSTYKQLIPYWQDWKNVEKHCHELVQFFAKELSEFEHDCP